MKPRAPGSLGFTLNGQIVDGQGLTVGHALPDDARLFAASPDMLAVLEDMIERVGADRVLRGALTKQLRAARTAVALARGEP